MFEGGGSCWNLVGVTKAVFMYCHVNEDRLLFILAINSLAIVYLL